MATLVDTVQLNEYDRVETNKHNLDDTVIIKHLTEPSPKKLKTETHEINESFIKRESLSPLLIGNLDVSSEFILDREVLGINESFKVEFNDREFKMDDEIRENMVMLGKIQGFPKWPCVILNVNDYKLCEKPNTNEHLYKVQFFNDGQIGWLTNKDLSSFEENKETLLKNNFKNKKLSIAVRDAVNQLQLKTKNPDHYIKTHQSPLKNGCKRKKQSSLNNSIIKNEPFEKSNSLSSSDISEPNQIVGIIIGKGFLGQEITKTLLSAGYTVNFFDAESDKSDRMEKELKTYGNISVKLSVRSVIINSPKTFICLSDKIEAKKIIGDHFDPDDNIFFNRGIINLTNVEPDVSVEFSKIVEQNGGNFLEMSVQGGKTEASEGNLMLFCSGNEKLFQEILPFLDVIGNCAYHLGTIGFASKINLTLQMIKAVNLAVLGESFSLIKSLGIREDKFVEILDSSGLVSDYIKGKINAINEKKFTNVEEPLDDLQQQLKLSLEMADKVDQPLALVDSANQMFKHCQRLKYGGHDVSAVVLKNQYQC